MQHGFDVSLVWQSLRFRLRARKIQVRFRHADGDIP